MELDACVGEHLFAGTRRICTTQHLFVKTRVMCTTDHLFAQISDTVRMPYAVAKEGGHVDNTQQQQGVAWEIMCAAGVNVHVCCTWQHSNRECCFEWIWD